MQKPLNLRRKVGGGECKSVPLSAGPSPAAETATSPASGRGDRAFNRVRSNQPHPPIHRIPIERNVRALGDVYDAFAQHIHFRREPEPRFG